MTLENKYRLRPPIYFASRRTDTGGCALGSLLLRQSSPPGDEPEDHRHAETPTKPTPHSDKSLPSKHRAMGTHDAYSIVLVPPCLRRRFRCRDSAAHDLPQLRFATCAPVIGACRS